MDCDQVRDVIFMFFDNELDEELMAPFQSHLRCCCFCAQRLDYTRKLLFLLRESCHRRSAPQHLRVRILTSFPHRRQPL